MRDLGDGISIKSSFFINHKTKPTLPHFILPLFIFIYYTLYFHESRCDCVQTGIGRDHGERKGLPQAHQDLGAVRRFHEDPQRSEEVSLTEDLNHRTKATQCTEVDQSPAPDISLVLQFGI